MPDDLLGNEDELGDYGDDVPDESGEEELHEEPAHEADEEIENEVFAMARENKEMGFANQEMVDKITKIEDQMMDQKKWTMQGEVECKDRNYNSLLEEFVDFDTATKLPP